MALRNFIMLIVYSRFHDWSTSFYVIAYACFHWATPQPALFELIVNVNVNLCGCWQLNDLICKMLTIALRDINRIWSRQYEMCTFLKVMRYFSEFCALFLKELRTFLKRADEALQFLPINTETIIINGATKLYNVDCLHTCWATYQPALFELIVNVVVKLCGCWQLNENIHVYNDVLTKK